MSQDLGFDVELRSPFDEAVSLVKDALKREGFGILTEIDLQAAFREKLGREFRPYAILGACNPLLAFSAINADPAVGLLLPCNVTIEALDERRSLVRLTNPETLLSVSALSRSPDLAAVARDGSDRMTRVLSALRGGSSG